MMETGAGSSGFLVATDFTGTNWTPCGFCTPAAGSEKRAKPTSARLACESLAVENWDKGYSPDNEFMSNCGLAVARAASYVRTSDLRLAGHGDTAGGWDARESSRSLQTISLGETVGNRTGRTQGGLAASKTMRNRGLRGVQRMANGLHKVGMRVEEMQPFSNAVE